MRVLSRLVCGVATITLITMAVFAEELNPGGQPFPDVQLPAAAPADALLNLMQDKLPAVAKYYGKTANELRGLAAQDHSLWADTRGRLLFVCAGVPVEAAQTTSDAVVAAGPYPADQTFQLHSRPGATKIIYLDFDGHTTSGTYWNGGATFVTPPYDIDGNTASFSTQELDNIQYIWQRVAEDYAPFNVDVTTQDPGVEALRKTSSSDANYGTRVCLGGSSYDWYGAGAGGVAYIGSFNWNSDTPCYVFTAQLGNGAEKYTAEAASHEAGHTLGLYHDGLTDGTAYYAGHGNWAPIMGVGYYKNITQWSKGEYANANNTEDDLAVMQTYGISYMADDHGGGTGDATDLTATNPTATGLISRNTDQDVFRFQTGAGTVSFTVNPAPRGPNLDIQLELYDGSGAFITSGNPSTLAATLSTNLPAGVYYLLVDGVGTGDPTTGYSDYDSLGQYSLSGTVVDTGTSQPPVAAASATPTNGLAPLAVTFFSAGSTDPDGTITAYGWDFGDGNTSTVADPSHTYNSPGSYGVVLTVWDNDGLADTDGLAITVNSPPNQSPVAVPGATPTSGTAPLAVAFSSAGSYDPDGSLTGYSWSFGDGGTSSAANPSHTYNTAGSYSARLIVTDNQGATATNSVVITVQPGLAQTCYVANIQMSLATGKKGTTATATVTIINGTGTTLKGATVTGTWSGIVSGTTTKTAPGRSTTVSLNSPLTKQSHGTFTFTITSVSVSGYTYNAGLNVETSDSITF